MLRSRDDVIRVVATCCVAIYVRSTASSIFPAIVRSHPTLELLFVGPARIDLFDRCDLVRQNSRRLLDVLVRVRPGFLYLNAACVIVNLNFKV